MCYRSAHKKKAPAPLKRPGAWQRRVSPMRDQEYRADVFADPHGAINDFIAFLGEPGDYRASAWDRETTAYHEAGHAYVALTVGLPIWGVVLYQDAGGGPRGRLVPSRAMRGKRPGGCSRRTELRRTRLLLPVLWAGTVAESFLVGGLSWRLGAFGGCSDLPNSARLVENVYGPTANASRRWVAALAHANRILTSDGAWDSVRRIAAQLLEDGSLGPKTVRSLMATEA